MRVLKVVLLVLLVAGCVYVISDFRLSKHFPIKTVRVYGVKRANQQDIQTVLTPLVTHGFFGISVDYVRDRLLQQPWVADIFVRRHWPDQIEITVIEKNAIARWNHQALLSESGVLFVPKDGVLQANLPTFIGPIGKQMVMLDYFKEINRILAPLHAKISYLELTSYLTWKVRLDNGITLQIGHKDVLTRLNHFVKVYPKIIGDHAAAVDSVDLRYPNGVAVRWIAPVKA